MDYFSISNDQTGQLIHASKFIKIDFRFSTDLEDSTDSRRIKDLMIWILDEIHRDKETISTRLSYPRSSLIYLITRNKNHQKVSSSIYPVVFTVYATRLNYLFDWFIPQFNSTIYLRSFESTFLSNNLWTTSSLETGLKVLAGNDSKIF